MRAHSFSRRLMCENRLSLDDLIYPTFIAEGQVRIDPVKSMPGVYRYSIDKWLELADRIAIAGIPVMAVFPTI